VWDEDTKKLSYVLRGHTSSVECLAIIPGTHFLASGGGDGSVIFFDLSTRKKLSHSLADEGGHSSCVKSLLTVPCTTLLISCSTDNTIKVWDVFTRACLRTLAGHTSAVFALANVPGGLVASSSADGSIRVWNPESSQCVRIIADADFREKKITVRERPPPSRPC
jgi:WD40 repeat protein